ncbi:MAG: hypothetical protein ABI317_15975, partial [Gaiellales bacterium]
LHQPSAAGLELTAGGGGPSGVRDLGWETVWIVPLVAAVLALSAYPYFVTNRVDQSVHALTAPAALEAGR